MDNEIYAAVCTVIQKSKETSTLVILDITGESPDFVDVDATDYEAVFGEILRQGWVRVRYRQTLEMDKYKPTGVVDKEFWFAKKTERNYGSGLPHNELDRGTRGRGLEGSREHVSESRRTRY